MTSPVKIESNRRNAQKSSGPKTKRGKKHARLNALKYSWYSTTSILPGESENGFRELEREIFEAHQPIDPIEITLAHQLIQEIWNLERLNRGERAYQKKLLEQLANHRANSAMIEHIRDECRNAIIAPGFIHAEERIEKHLRTLPQATPTASDIDDLFARSVADTSTVQIFEIIERRRRAIVRTICQVREQLQEIQRERRTITIEKHPIAATQLGNAKVIPIELSSELAERDRKASPVSGDAELRASDTQYVAVRNSVRGS
jgi:hypothetical protein